jgi:hypothetical protein
MRFSLPSATQLLLRHTSPVPTQSSRSPTAPLPAYAPLHQGGQPATILASRNISRSMQTQRSLISHLLRCQCRRSCHPLTPSTSFLYQRPSRNLLPLLLLPPLLFHIQERPPAIRGCLPANRGCLAANGGRLLASRGCVPARRPLHLCLQLTPSPACRIDSAPRDVALSAPLLRATAMPYVLHVRPHPTKPDAAGNHPDSISCTQHTQLQPAPCRQNFFPSLLLTSGKC